MIVDAFLTFLSGLTSWVVSVRPSWTLSLPSGVASLVTWLYGLDSVLPVTEAVTVLGSVVTLVAAMNLWKWSVKIVDWVADVLP